MSPKRKSQIIMDIMITGGHARDGVDYNRILDFAMTEDFVGLNIFLHWK